MPGTLVIAEHLQGQLRDVTLECVTAPRAGARPSRSV